MSEELKPCPFCGGKADYIKTEDRERYPHRVACTVCGTQTNGSAFKCDSYNSGRWNTRHLTRADIPESLIKEIQAEALDNALKSMANPLNNASRFSSGYRMARKHLSKIKEKLREQ